jgi:hypothetical protein
VGEVVDDIRTERRSAATVRQCTQCADFRGNRADTAEHVNTRHRDHAVVEAQLRSQVETLTQEIKAATVALTGYRANEETLRLSKCAAKSKLEIDVLHAVYDALNTTHALACSVLRAVHGNPGTVNIFKAGLAVNTACYIRDAKHSYEYKITTANYNVALFVFRKGEAPPDKTGRYVFLHPDDPSKNRSFGPMHEWTTKDVDRGWANALSLKKLDSFTRNGHFAVAVF